MSDIASYEYEEQEAISRPRSRVWRFLYALGVLIIIIILIFSTSGLSHWLIAGRLSKLDLRGETEAEILVMLGEPDYRSEVQPFIPGEGIGMVPRHLDQGDEFYDLIYLFGPRLYIFHFVSPDTFTKHTGQLVLGEEWVVLEYYSGSRYVLY